MKAVDVCTSGYCPPVIAQRTLNASHTQAATISSGQSLEMELVTKEGDKVTFSLDAKTSALYGSHVNVEIDDDSVSASRSEISGGRYERQMTFTVEGDLNKEERREIRKVMRTINRMMGDFVQGRLNPMADKVQKLQGLDTIDHLEVDMSYEREVVVTRQTQAAVTYDHTGEASEIQRPVTTHVAQRPVMAASEDVARKMARQVARSQAPKEPLQDLADRLLKAYRDQSARWNSVSAQIVDHMREVFAYTLNGVGSQQIQTGTTA